MDFSALGEHGILFFPVTPYDGEGRIRIDLLAEHIESRMPWKPDAVFVACGTGEFLSYGLEEYREAVAAAVGVVAGRVPVFAGAGYTAALASEFTERAAEAGADGILLFPAVGPYTQRGLVEHYSAVAARSALPIILYQRDGVKLGDETVRRLLDVDTIVGLKDGVGDVERAGRTRVISQGRWAMFNGMPTAELSARAYAGIGVRPYSSAAFAFIPELATRFRTALDTGDEAVLDQLVAEFYGPLGELRDKGAGYLISLVKAALAIRGFDAGAPRSPIGRPEAAHEDALRALIDRGLELAVG